MHLHAIENTTTTATPSESNDLPAQDISTEVLREKYAKDRETSIEDVNQRCSVLALTKVA